MPNVRRRVTRSQFRNLPNGAIYYDAGVAGPYVKTGNATRLTTDVIPQKDPDQTSVTDNSTRMIEVSDFVLNTQAGAQPFSPGGVPGSDISNGDPTVFPEQVMAVDGVLYPVAAEDYFLRIDSSGWTDSNKTTWNTVLSWDVPGIIRTLQDLATDPFTDLVIWVQRSDVSINTPNDVNPLQDPPLFSYSPNSLSLYGNQPWVNGPRNSKPAEWMTPKINTWTSIMRWGNTADGQTAPPIQGIPTTYTDTAVPSPCCIYRLVAVFKYPNMAPSIYEIDWNICSTTNTYTLTGSNVNGLITLNWTDPASSLYSSFDVQSSNSSGVWNTVATVTGDLRTKSGLTPANQFRVIGHLTNGLTVLHNEITAMPLQWVAVGTAPGGVAAQVSPRGTARDSLGNVLICGIIQGTINFGNGPIFSLGGAAFMAKYTSNGALLWARKLAVNDLGNGAYGMAVDSQDNIILTGVFTHQMDLGGGVVISDTGTNGNIFVAKYASDGTTLSWVRGYGSTGQDLALSVGTDASGNVFIGGVISGTVTFGNITLTAPTGNVVLVKISSSGTPLWGKNWGGSAGSDRAFAIAVDHAGDLLATGAYSNGANPGGGAVSGAGMFLAKYSGVDGTYQWAKTLPGGSSIGWAVTTDPTTRNVVFTGTMAGVTNFGGGNVGPGGLFLACYGPTGTSLWAKCFNSSISGFSSGDSGYGVAVDSSGDISFAGAVLTSPVSFDGSKGWYGGSNMFIARFSSSGAFKSAIRGAGSGQTISYTTIFNNSGLMVTSGNFYGTANFGGISKTTSAFGNYEPFVAAYMM